MKNNNQYWKDIWPQISVLINKEFFLPRVLYYLKLYVKVTVTVWKSNTGRGNSERPVGTSQMMTATT